MKSAIFVVVLVIVCTCAADSDLCSNGITSCSSDIPCPAAAGGTCANGTTCCPKGCCPLPQAVCCSDKVHCCPSGTFCNLELKMCIGSGEQSFSVFQKRRRQDPYNISKPSVVEKLSTPAKTQLKDIPCPSAGGSCPDGTTCCPLGCCPFPKAVCCKGRSYCCPSGMTCDPEHGNCVGIQRQVFSIRQRTLGGIGSTEVFDSEMTRVALSVKAEVVYCPGGRVYCPDFNTCCILPNGAWGCCPFPSATCCPDKIHCCPAGHWCDATSQHCLSGNGYEYSRKKFPALSLGND